MTEYVYDNLYRLTSELWKSGGSTIRTLEWTYNAVGELTLADDPAATYSYTRDSLGRVTSEGQVIDGLTPAVTYDSTYNAASLLTEVLTTLGSIDDFKNEYTYDNLLRLTRLEQSGQSGGNVVAEKRVDFAYNAAGQFSQITRYADLAGTEFVANTFYAYDGMGRLAKLLHTVDGSLPGSG